MNWSDKDIEILVRMRDEGENFGQIAKRLGRSTTATRAKFYRITPDEAPTRVYTIEEIKQNREKLLKRSKTQSLLAEAYYEIDKLGGSKDLMRRIKGEIK